mmetsp:Transcript_92003/g.281555  ORF Transcript_92003/g.281555 Transcript_92003/m.281555 type:complete len:255 (-) Transcript_92003:221-985(-)
MEFDDVRGDLRGDQAAVRGRHFGLLGLLRRAVIEHGFRDVHVFGQLRRQSRHHAGLNVRETRVLVRLRLGLLLQRCRLDQAHGEVGQRLVLLDKVLTLSPARSFACTLPRPPHPFPGSASLQASSAASTRTSTFCRSRSPMRIRLNVLASVFRGIEFFSHEHEHVLQFAFLHDYRVHYIVQMSGFSWASLHASSAASASSAWRSGCVFFACVFRGIGLYRHEHEPSLRGRITRYRPRRARTTSKGTTTTSSVLS